MGRNKLILKPGKEQSLRRYHPWIFSGAVQEVPAKTTEGEMVDVFSSTGQYLATGHYQKSSIAVRVLSFTRHEFDQTFWDARILSAWKLREEAGLAGQGSTNAFRLVNGEGDSMPGLIIDFYNGTAVFQAHSAGMYLVRDQIVRALESLPGKPVSAVYDKSSNSLPFKSGLEPKDGYLSGSGSVNEVTENGHRFLIDWEKGQKTGFFLDQRENRQLLSRYSQGRHVLNMFGYTGGFSVYALAGGAALVHTVDASEQAISMAVKNVGLNFGDDAPHQAFAMDASGFFMKNKADYDLIILDPPAFAKHQNVLNNALQGYKNLNRTAMEKILPGGILFTFSCSQVVSRENFRKSVFAAAANTGRRISILHQLSQPADHPVSIYHPEGEYLKGLVLRVE